MKRRTFDLLASLAGLAAAVLLLVVALILQSNANFAKDNVRDQLSQQRIMFTAEDKLKPDERAKPDLVKYAGQQVDSGEKARVFADDYIGLHLQNIGKGKTYQEVSGASQANPSDTALAQQAQTLFRGETLRGVLLTAYAFDTMGEKAQQAATVLYIGSGLFLVFSILGFVHYRKTPHTAEI